MNKKVFLLCGKARCGKDTAAKIIKAYYDDKAIITSIAKYIKLYAMEITNWDGLDQDKPRTLLQELGTDIVREKLGKTDLYINRLLDDIDVYHYFSDIVVVKDVRFPREIELVKKKYTNVITIHIKRINFTNELDAKQQSHPTETAFDNYHDFDYEVINDDFKDLEEDIINILKGIK
jgi:hypothetical protein